jgi:hypothetical protein
MAMKRFDLEFNQHGQIHDALQLTKLHNKAAVAMVWATPRWLHQAIFARIMND